MFVQVSGPASHVHNSIHCTLCSGHEQRLLHERLTHPHFTSYKTDCGARGTLVRTGMSSQFASHDHPRVVGSSIGLFATSTCHTWHCRCARHMYSYIAPWVGGSFSIP